MAKILPWSYTALDAHKNCPRQFHEKYVLKSIVEKPSPEMAYGRDVHKSFENRAKSGTSLPPNLAMHEGYLKYLTDMPGENTAEQKISLNIQVKPCGYSDQDVWYRGAIDFKNLYGEEALIVDYKTGKPHQKFEQLMTFALHTFILHPQVKIVDGRYYWTQTRDQSRKVWARSEIPDMWASLTPALKQYVESFQTDTWTPRQSGLCRRHCPVSGCEFNGGGYGG